MRWLPPAPAERPFEWGRAKWDDPEWMRNAIRKVYGHRSNALHQAIPLPPPMCEVPFNMPQFPAPSEVPHGLAQGIAGGTWLIEDTPFNLHTFEYITRGALLRSLRAH